MIPNEPTLANVAQQIVEGRATDNLQFWVVFFVLAALTGLVIWFVVPYLGERGKLLAMAETLDHRLKEIRQMTDVSERVKAQIAHSDWTVKEYKTLRRNKLEELLAATFRLMLACEYDIKLQKENYDFEITSREFAVNMRQISALYFAELRDEVEAVMTAHSALAVWVITQRGKLEEAKLHVKYRKEQLEILKAAPDSTLNGRTLIEHRAWCHEAQDTLSNLKTNYANEYEPINFNLHQAINALQARSTLLMAELIAPAHA